MFHPFSIHQQSVTRPRWSRSAALAALLGCVFTCSLIGQDEPVVTATPVDKNAVRNAATVVAKPYEPASRREMAADAEIVAESENFKKSATFGSMREQASSLASLFGRGGGLHREAWWNGDVQGHVLDYSGTSLSLGLDEIYRRTLAHSKEGLAPRSLIAREGGSADR